MTHGWSSAALKDFCSVEKSKYDGAELPYVGLEHIESNTGKYLGGYEPVEVKSSTFRFTINHILYGRLRPYLNKVLLPEFDGHCSSEIFPIRVNSSVEKKFLYYWLTWDPVVERINRTSTGTRMPRANVNKILEFKFPVPPLPEQKRIVAILDEAFAGIDTAIANTEKNLANACELFESYLNGILFQPSDGAEEIRLGEYAEIAYGYTAKASNSRCGPKFLRITDIKNNAVDWGAVPYCEIDGGDHKKHSLNDGDIVFARTGATTGKSFLVKEPPDAVCASYLIKVKVDNTLLSSDFLALYFQTKRYWNSIQSGVSGSAQGGFNASKLSALNIPLVSKKAQMKIVMEAESIRKQTDQLEAIYQQKLTALAELKQSLLQKAFSGELTADNAREAEAVV